MNEIGFRAAFAMRGFNFTTQKYEFKTDERYVKWIIRERYQRDYDQSWRIIPHRKCTESDFE